MAGDSIWKDARTAYGPFLERGMTTSQITAYFHLHKVPNKLNLAKNECRFCQVTINDDIHKCPLCNREEKACGAKKRIRMFDMRAVRTLLEVHLINNARNAQFEL